MLLNMFIPEYEQYPVIRMHFQMVHFVLRVLVTKSSGDSAYFSIFSTPSSEPNIEITGRPDALRSAVEYDASRTSPS